MEDLIIIIQNYKLSRNFDEIYQLYEKKICNIAKNFRIEEHSTMLMIKLWKLTSTIDLDNFSSSELLDSYINKSLKRWAINLYRKYVKHNIVMVNDLVVDFELDKAQLSSIEYISDLEFFNILESLSSRQYKVIILRYKIGLTDEQIGNSMGISRQAVYKQRIQALSTLRYQLYIYNKKEGEGFMPEEIFKLVSAQGIWALLSFILIFYILKAQENRDQKQDTREQKYQEIISELTDKFEVIYTEIQDIKKIFNK